MLTLERLRFWLALSALSRRNLSFISWLLICRSFGSLVYQLLTVRMRNGIYLVRRILVWLHRLLVLFA